MPKIYMRSWFLRKNEIVNCCISCTYFSPHKNSKIYAMHGHFESTCMWNQKLGPEDHFGLYCQKHKWSHELYVEMRS